jgi:Holliday junction resolvase
LFVNLFFYEYPGGIVKQKVIKILEEAGAYFFYPVSGGYGASGVPDVVACFKSKFIGIECKAGKNVPTALQLKNLAAISKNGGYSLIINEDNIDELGLCIKRIMEGR